MNKISDSASVSMDISGADARHTIANILPAGGDLPIPVDVRTKSRSTPSGRSAQGKASIRANDEDPPSDAVAPPDTEALTASPADSPPTEAQASARDALRSTPDADEHDDTVAIGVWAASGAALALIGRASVSRSQAPVRVVEVIPAGQASAEALVPPASQDEAPPAEAIDVGIEVTAPGEPAAEPSTAPADPTHADPTHAVPPQPGRLTLTAYADTGATPFDRIGQSGDFRLALAQREPSAQVRYEASLDGGLSWQPTPEQQLALADGHYQFRALSTDEVGHTAFSMPVSVTVDTQAPDPGVLEIHQAVDERTGTQRVLLNVTGLEAGAQTAFEVSVDNGNTWRGTAADLPSMVDGRYQFRAVITDVAGNRTEGPAQDLVVDSTPPAIGLLRLKDFVDAGPDSLDFHTNDDVFTLSMDAEPGSIVRYEHSDDDGLTWRTIDPEVRGLGDQHHLFRAFATDAQGRTAFSGVTGMTIDKTPPPPVQLAVTQRGADVALAPIVAGVASEGLFSYQFSRDGVQWLPCSASPRGLPDGSYQFRVTLMDKAGNVAISAAVAVQVDTADPVAGSLTLTNFQDTGQNALDRVTASSDFTLTATGVAVGATSILQLSNNGGLSWRTTTAEQVNVREGDYLFRIKATAADGKVSYSRAVDVTVDQTPPDGGRLAVTDWTDTGRSNSDRISQDNSFALTYTGGDPDTVALYDVSKDGGRTWTPCGVRFENLPDGRYWFRAASADLAGNEGVGPAVLVVVDTTAPVAGWLTLDHFIDTGAAQDLITANGSFTLGIRGQEAGATVVFQRSADEGGTWLATEAVQTALPDGRHLYRAVVTDAAGNAAASGPLQVEIDSVAPNAGTLQLVVHPSRDRTSIELLLEGAEHGATTRFEVSADNGLTWCPTTPRTDDVPDGNYLFRALVKDQAGNAARSDSVLLVVAGEGSDAGLWRDPPPATVATVPMWGGGIGGAVWSSLQLQSMAGELVV